MFLKTLLQKIKNEQGAIFVLTAVVLPVMIGLAGLGYDVGNLYMHKGRLQHVADAAVLAGAREFVNHGEVADDSLATRNLIPYSENMELPSRSGVHENADKEADKYIKSNIVNLHNGVSSDEYSHLALQSVGDNAKTYYRVGLSEKVRLHFLPLIPGIGHEATVRASAVALAENQVNPSVLPPLPVSPNADESYSIFDNLYTFSEYMKLEHINDNKKPKFAFNGRIIYTMLNNNTEVSQNDNFFYDLVMNASMNNGKNEHIFNETGINNWGVDHRNDPYVNPFFNTRDYDDAFKKRLKELDKDGNKNHYEITDSGVHILNRDYINANLKYKVFHYAPPENETGELSISIMGTINTYTDNDSDINYNVHTPVYVIVEENVRITDVNLKDNIRPVILVYFGTEPISLEGGGNNNDTTNLVIYAPNAEVILAGINGTYNGNIIAKVIRTEGSSNAGLWNMKNFLKNDNYTDQYVEERRLEIVESITANNSSNGQDIVDKLYNLLKNDTNFTQKFNVTDVQQLLLLLGYYKDKREMDDNYFNPWYLQNAFTDAQKRILANALKEILYGDHYGDGSGYTGGSGGSGGNSEQPEDTSSAKVRLISDSEIKSSPFAGL